MQIERLHEPVKVRADFEGGAIHPLIVGRGDRSFRVTALCASWIDRSGRYPRHGFSVRVDSGDVLQLSFETQDLTWTIESVCMP